MKLRKLFSSVVVHSLFLISLVVFSKERLGDFLLLITAGRKISCNIINNFFFFKFQNMVKLSQDTKHRLGVIINAGKTIFHWGFMPAVIYLGNFEVRV